MPRSIHPGIGGEDGHRIYTSPSSAPTSRRLRQRQTTSRANGISYGFGLSGDVACLPPWVACVLLMNSWATASISSLVRRRWVNDGSNTHLQPPVGEVLAQQLHAPVASLWPPLHSKRRRLQHPRQSSCICVPSPSLALEATRGSGRVSRSFRGASINRPFLESCFVMYLLF